jgi:hypothetical protein
LAQKAYSDDSEPEDHPHKDVNFVEKIVGSQEALDLKLLDFYSQKWKKNRSETKRGDSVV